MNKKTHRLAKLAAVTTLILGAAAVGSDQQLRPTTRDGKLSPLLSKLGNLHRAVSTHSKAAQKYFDQGLTLYYAFNHAEAARSFQEATRQDPKLAIAYWGEAISIGPNINDAATEPEREKQAHEAMQKALANRRHASAKERAMIDALAKRFSSPVGQDREQRMSAYAEAMEGVYRRYPRDPDVGTFYAGAVMDSMPWNYYEKDGTAKPSMSKAIKALESVIRYAPEHPGAHHYYIHAVEASPTPERALPSARKLPSLVPGAGHLLHMPAHIYIRTGMYREASLANVEAIKADEDYITQCKAQGIYPAAYFPHAIHFMTATLAMEGRSREMLDAANKVAHHAHGGLDQPGFGFPHLLMAIPKLAYVRFGMWPEILALPVESHSPFDLGMLHYSRGIALTATGNVDAAERELAAMKPIAARPDLATLKIFDMNSLAELIAIAEQVLAGEIAAKRGQHDAAVTHLRKAVELDDAMLYSEPPDWPNPPRHNLGAVLLGAGRAAEAEAVYREDLKRHAKNGWALMGLIRALDKQGRAAEAAKASVEFKTAWKGADRQIASSRF